MSPVMISGPGLRPSGTLCPVPGAEFPELLLKSKSRGSAKQFNIFFNMALTPHFRARSEGNRSPSLKDAAPYVSRAVSQLLSVMRGEGDVFLNFLENVSITRDAQCVPPPSGREGWPFRKSAFRSLRCPAIVDFHQNGTPVCRCSLPRASPCKGPVGPVVAMQIPIGSGQASASVPPLCGHPAVLFAQECSF